MSSGRLGMSRGAHGGEAVAEMVALVVVWSAIEGVC